MLGGGSTEPPLLRDDQALFLDFDGTVVEIASEPHLVNVPAELPQLLTGLTDRLAGAVAVVSGRRLEELARMLAPFAGAIAGGHGLDRRRSNGNVSHCQADPQLDRFRPSIAVFATRHEGVLLEDKGSS